MRRWGFRFALTAIMLGAFSAWVVTFRMGLQLEARKVADRLVDEAQEAAACGDRRESRRLVEEALDIDGKNPRAHRELAMQLLGEGHRERALEELLRVAETKRSDPGAARELAALLWKVGNRKGAVRWLREAVRRDSMSGLALVELAQCLLEIGDSAGALEAAEDAVSLYPHWQFSWRNLGLVCRQNGDLMGARAALDKALKLRPNDVTVLVTAADVSHELGERDAAIGYARRAVAADPQSDLTWFALGQLLLATGEEAEAQKALANVHALGGVPPVGVRRSLQPGR